MFDASAVSKAWREVILKDARLWTNIVTRTSRNNGGLRALLARGQTHPVSLHIALTDLQNDLGDILAASLWRMRRIVISSILEVEDLLALGLFNIGLARPAPCLEYFEMSLGWDAGNDISFDASLFSAHAPALEELWLDVPCMPVLDAFPNLRVVVLSDNDGQDFQFVWNLLSLCPSLEHAAICVRNDDGYPRSFTGTPPQLAALQSLRVAISAEYDDTMVSDAERLLSILSAEVRSRINLTLTPVILHNDLSIGADTLLIVEAQGGIIDEYTACAFGAHRPMRRFLRVGRMDPTAFVHEQLVFSCGTLQELTVPALLLQFAYIHPRPTFPRLHTYTVSLTRRHEAFQQEGSRLLLDGMPALRRLVLRREPRAAALSQDVRVQSDMLLSCLATNRAGLPPIATLVLQGVRTRLTSADVQPYAQELVREPWEQTKGPEFDRMDQWLFLAARS
ncbi:hypothetical protein AURDEDRAFT_160851 [Auricularia subglabra TFB-10046 SS5]|nr:hypothetical protein AURDEDRAFT_160851 [Auricularia subglabra TFB-10046 SS5]